MTMYSGIGKDEDTLVDVVVLMRPPMEWWPLGVVGYPGDYNGILASINGYVPDSSLVRREFQLLTTLLVDMTIPHVILNFPSALSIEAQPPRGAYDAVFLHDCAVINASGTAYVPARFRDWRRQVEAPFVWSVLDALGLQRLCDANEVAGFVEGGDTITGGLPSGEEFVLSGTQRNDARGNAFLREILEIPAHNQICISSDVCHIDSVMCAISTPTRSGWVLRSLLMCPGLVDSEVTELERLTVEQGLSEPIAVSWRDTGFEGGTLAVNGISVRSSSGDLLISGARFVDEHRVEQEMQAIGFRHVSSPLSQYLRFSSGGVRSCAQVVRVSPAALRRLKAALPSPEIAGVWVPN